MTATRIIGIIVIGLAAASFVAHGPLLQLAVILAGANQVIRG